MAAHHEPFKALSPVEWEKLVPSGLKHVLDTAISSALTIADSIPRPEPSPSSPSSPGRARSQTDSAIRSPDIEELLLASSRRQRQTAESMARAQDLRKDWREVKVAASGSKDNPHGISVYKLAAKDGRGSWFARRSVHEGVGFETWKTGLEMEFGETMKREGAGNIRGIGAERVVEKHSIDSTGKAEVFQLSARFPGPTAPRDFVTLLLTSERGRREAKDAVRPLRHFVVVSKPCIHPDCPPRQGFIRGQYESVEVIREIAVAAPELKRTRSSIDLSRDDSMQQQLDTPATDSLSKDALIRAARRHAAASAPASEDDAEAAVQDDSKSESAVRIETMAVAVEWLMVTRSDPGGSVPRFMIEKGTPGAIVSDAGKFFKWLTISSPTPSGPGVAVEVVSAGSSDRPRKSMHVVETRGENKYARRSGQASGGGGGGGDERQETVSQHSQHSNDDIPSSNGLYGMLTAAVGLASSVVAARLPYSFARSITGRDSEEDRSIATNDEDSESDASSVHSFASARESLDLPGTPNAQADAASHRSDSSTAVGGGTNGTAGSSGNGTAGGGSDQRPTQNEKELRKLEERRRKLEEKMRRQEERQREKEAAALARLKEKQAKEEERYQRELRRLEQRREQDERKTAERRLTAELEKVTVERDLARQQIPLLLHQLGELQRENTMLVAKLGKIGGMPKVGGGGSGSPTTPANGSVAGTDTDRSSVH